MKKDNKFSQFEKFQPRPVQPIPHPEITKDDLNAIGKFNFFDWIKNWANIIKLLKFIYKVVKFIIIEFKNDFVAYDSRIEKLKSGGLV